MTTPFIKDTTTKYVNRDFASLKRDLMAYAQAHFSGSFQDFNETSAGMAVLEFQAFVGDVLSFYMDQQFLEIKQETARQLKNVESFAKQLGYKPKGKRAARVLENWIVELPAISDGAGNRVPDLTYAPILRAGSQVGGPAGTFFETLQDVDFSQGTFDPSATVASRFDQNGQIVNFAVRRGVDSIAGTTVSEIIPVGAFEPYLRVPLSNTNVQEILSVVDGEGNVWYEVDYLAQNVVFDQIVNTGSDSNVVPYVLKFRAAPRRFVLDRSLAENSVNLQFGAGQGLKFDDEIVPNTADLALLTPGRATFSNVALDPQNFLKTRSMGLCPFDTSLTIVYRVGGGDETNVAPGSINNPTNVILNFKASNLDPTKVSAVQNSVECVNVSASEGGGPPESISEIKANAGSFFAAQQRCVTRDDYLTHVLSMPEKFGRVHKAYVKQSDNNPYSVDIHVLSKDFLGSLDKPSVMLKTNIVTYLSKLRMITEGVNILPANVIDVGLTFGVVVSPRVNRPQVLANCLDTMKNFFSLDNWQIGQPIVLSVISEMLSQIDGVISVYRIDVKSFNGITNGLSYSDDVSNFDVAAATKYGIIYCPPDSIFQLHYPNSDLIGESK